MYGPTLRHWSFENVAARDVNGSASAATHKSAAMRFMREHTREAFARPPGRKIGTGQAHGAKERERRVRVQTTRHGNDVEDDYRGDADAFARAAPAGACRRRRRAVDGLLGNVPSLLYRHRALDGSRGNQSARKTLRSHSDGRRTASGALRERRGSSNHPPVYP